MKSYRVEWAIDIEAENPVQAAQEAFRLMQKPGTTANVFEVWQEDADECTVIDLEEVSQL